ncbi:hypothetical protein COBT_001810 [Conglomerata obtusa]
MDRLNEDINFVVINLNKYINFIQSKNDDVLRRLKAKASGQQIKKKPIFRNNKNDDLAFDSEDKKIYELLQKSAKDCNFKNFNLKKRIVGYEFTCRENSYDAKKGYVEITCTIKTSLDLIKTNLIYKHFKQIKNNVLKDCKGKFPDFSFFPSFDANSGMAPYSSRSFIQNFRV